MFGISIFSRDDKRVIRLSIIAQCQLEGFDLGSDVDRKTVSSVLRGGEGYSPLSTSFLVLDFV